MGDGGRRSRSCRADRNARMNKQPLHDRLVDLHAELARFAAKHRELCSAPTPDATAIGSARWRIAQAGRCRMALLSETIFPLLEVRCDTAERRPVEALHAATTDYRTRVSLYVSKWSMAAIINDWLVYRSEAETFRLVVKARIAEERSLLLPLLLRHAG